MMIILFERTMVQYDILTDAINKVRKLKTSKIKPQETRFIKMQVDKGSTPNF